MMNKLNTMLVGLNNKLMEPKPSLTSPLLPIETERSLNKLLLIENGSKVKSLTQNLILNGLPEDKNKLTELSNNFS